MNIPAKRLPALVCFLCLAQSALACLQVSEAEHQKETAKDHLQQARQLRALSRGTPPGDAGRPYVADPALTLSSQYEAEALHHIFAGRPAPAVQLLVAAEKAAPGSYSVAANLGTAHELNGQNQAALRWIREAIARNPASHAGTEWVHVSILEAKVRRERAPDTPFTPLIPLPAKFDAQTPVTVLGASHPVSEIKFAVHYQLRERMKFVKPRDPYVADLLFTLSKIDGRLHGPRSAYEYLLLAERYGHADQAGIEAARNTYLPLIRKARLWAGTAYAFKLFGIGVLIYLALKALLRCIQHMPRLYRSEQAAGTTTGTDRSP